MPEDTFLADLLVHLGCRADRADEVIAAAIKDGEDPDYLRKQIELWRDYCLGPRGERIKAIGYFIAAKIEQSQPAPDLTPRPRDFAADWERYKSRLIRDWTTIDYMTHPAEHIAQRRQAVFDRLMALYEKQRDWIDEQNALDDAADLLTSRDIFVSPRAPWCWADSPVAAEIAQLETLLEVARVVV